MKYYFHFTLLCREHGFWGMGVLVEITRFLWPVELCGELQEPSNLAKFLTSKIFFLQN